MFINYLMLYLIFIIAVSVVISFLVMRLNLPAPKILIPVIIGVILLPGVLGYLFVTYFTSIPELAVPDVRGLPVAEAEIKLGTFQLKGRHAGSIFDPNYSEGNVVTQQPEPGRRVKVGRIIRLITSSGKRMVMVPNLLGRPVEQVRAVLSAKSLLLGTVEEDSAPGLDAGIILVQNPLPGEEIESGTFVSITISSSPEPTVQEEKAPLQMIPVRGSNKTVEKKKEEDLDQGGIRLWWW